MKCHNLLLTNCIARVAIQLTLRERLRVFEDIGANIGMFTVVVAAMGREVLAVDADPQNLAFIRKSLDLQKTRARVRLFSNAVSDEYMVLYPFSPDRETVPAST